MWSAVKSAVGMIWGEFEQDLYVDRTPGFHLPARPLPLSTQIPEKIFGGSWICSGFGFPCTFWEQHPVCNMDACPKIDLNDTRSKVKLVWFDTPGSVADRKTSHIPNVLPYTKRAGELKIPFQKRRHYARGPVMATSPGEDRVEAVLTCQVRSRYFLLLWLDHLFSGGHR